jgi:hypothetical protein
VLLVACGGSVSAPSAPSSPAPVAADPGIATTSNAPPDGPSSSSPAPSAALPTTCAVSTVDVCMPPASFAERLCAKLHQDAALALFAGTMPFSRMYMRGKMDELAADEEVLALHFHGVPKNGIQVGSAAGSYDVLRWDGTCAMAVDADMLTKNRPPRPKSARVQWHRLNDKTQTALIVASEAVKRAHARRGKECQGAMSGDVSASCEKADAALVEAVVEYVRGGGTVPPPDAL